MDVTDLLLHAIHGGYPLLLLVILLLIGFTNKHRESLYTFLATMNLLFAAAGIWMFGKLIWVSLTEEVGMENFLNRATGPYWFAYWFMMLSTILLPQLFWLKKYRRNIVLSLLAAAIPFYERLIILLTSFHRDYLPSSWTIRATIVGSALIQNMLLLLMLVLLLRLFIYSFKRLRLKGGLV